MFNNYFNFFFFNFLLTIFDPLEQFDVLIFKIPFIFELNNLIIFTFIVVLISYVLNTDISNFNKTASVDEIQIQSVLNFISFEIIKFVDSISDANTNLSKQFLFLIFYAYFFFILFANFIGLIPFSYTITSSFIVTLSISLFLFLLINFIGIYRVGLLPFMGLFIPTGTPLQIAFLLVIIEIVSYIARLFSLAIRLFANMMAGHTLLKILIGFSYTMLLSFSGLIPFSIIPWLLVTIIFVLEILISFLQAYVFIILVCIHSNDVVISH